MRVYEKDSLEKDYLRATTPKKMDKVVESDTSFDIKPGDPQ